MGVRFEWNGPQVAANVQAAAGRGLHQAAEFVLAKAREEVPIDEATLSRSGATDVDPQAGKATVSFDTPYAARQHEELTYRHAPGRKAKFLEDPLVETRDTQQRIIAGEISRELQ